MDEFISFLKENYPDWQEIRGKRREVLATLEDYYVDPILACQLNLEDTPDVLLKFFYYLQPVENKIIIKILGLKNIHFLLQEGWIAKSKKKYFIAKFKILKMANNIVVTPAHARVPHCDCLRPDFTKNAVMTFFPDSLLLAKNLMNLSKRYSSVLDIGQGNGIQSIVLASKAKQVLGIDINPFAIAIANINKEINQLKNVNFKRADFRKINNQFDLVVANPPFLPGITKDKTTFSYGGARGDEILQELFTRLPQLLTVDGEARIIAAIPRYKGQTLRDKLKTYIKDWQINLSFSSLPIGEITGSSLGDFLFFILTSKYGFSDKKFSQMLDLYYRHFLALDIDAVDYGIISLSPSKKQILKIREM